LHWPDILDSDGDKRLGWFLNRFDGNGSWRCGTNKYLHDTKKWEKVIYHAD